MIVSDFSQAAEDYARVEQAIHFIEKNAASQPSLEEIATSVHLSAYHFQRLFTRWAGISPKRFLQFLTKVNAKQALQPEGNILAATYQTGLSSPGRLHDLFVQCEAVSPGEYKSMGLGLHVSYGFHPTPFGDCLLAITPRGICFLAFALNNDRYYPLNEMKSDWENAQLQEAPNLTQPYIDRIFGRSSANQNHPLHLHVRGTNFQIKVWEALLRIPVGETISYGNLAAQVGQPKAARAVGSAVARNPISYIIPCHRVLRKSGEFGNYRYGPARKKALLLWEDSLTPSFPAATS